MKVLRYLLFFICLVTSPVFASPKLMVERFDLPQQSLQNGLIEFGLQAKVTLLVDQALLENKKMTEVRGAYSVDTALRKILSATDLDFRYLDHANAYLIEKKLPEVQIEKVVSEPVKISTVNIDEIRILGRLNYPMRYNSITNTQLHSGISYFDSSRFLNVIPRVLIEDQQASEMFDAVKYASGISSSDGLNDTNDDLYIRGFARHSIYVDGFRLGDNFGSKMLPANIERVEILKGPSTLLYGQAEPGGTVNFVRKRAEQNTFSKMNLGVGSSGKKILQLDTNNPVELMDDLDYRLIVSAEQKNEEAEIDDLSRQLISTSVTYHFTSDTDFSVHYDFQHSEQTDPRDFLVIRPFVDADGDEFSGANLADGIRNKRSGFTSDLKLFSTEFSHYFSTDWRVVLKYDWMDEDRLGIRTTTDTLLNTNGLVNPSVQFDTVFIFGAELLVPVNIIQTQTDNYFRFGRVRSLYDEEAYETANGLSLTSEGTSDVGQYIHHISVGLDWHQQDLYKGYRVEDRSVLPGQLFPESELDIYLADIVKNIFDQDRLLGNLSSQEMRLLYDDYGAYIQDSIELNDKWVVNAGTRLTSMQGEYTDITAWQFNKLQDYEQFSSQLGMVYKYSDEYSWYTNYSEALRANYHLDDVGAAPVDPELSYQFELGVKSLLDNGRFLSSIALFQIDKDNVVDHVIDQRLRTALGLYSVRATGIDMDFSWQFNSDWDLMGAVSYTSSEIVNGPYVGEKPNMAADQLASLFIHHRLTDALAINLGINYVGERESRNRIASAATSVDEFHQVFFLPAYATADLSINYQLKHLKFDPKIKLLIKNLTDTEYASSTVSGARENFAEGRFMQLSLEADF